jgi:serine phosphatase RsbU (regulator of sigma subunit)
VLEHERHIPNLFTTLCTLEINPQRDCATLILAGHPPPVLIRDGSVTPLSETLGGPPIGLGLGGWSHQSLVLPEGWALLLYTDGIIEGRIGAGSDRLGEQGLRELIGEYIQERPTWREQPEAMLQDLVVQANRLNGKALRDDVAMILVGAETK